VKHYCLLLCSTCCTRSRVLWLAFFEMITAGDVVSKCALCISASAYVSCGYHMYTRTQTAHIDSSNMDT
jgi:GTP-dependent phosphoenolpyruvate carboxykinase